MGVIVEPRTPPVLDSSTRAFSRPNRENPTLVAIRSRQQVEQAKRQAEQVVKEARELAEQALLQAAKQRRLACARQIEADRAIARVTEDGKRMKGVAKVEQRAQELAKDVRKAGRKEAAKLARKAKKERARSRKMRKDVEEAVAAAKKGKERALKVAAERRRDADAGIVVAEDISHAAAVKSAKAVEKIQQATMQLQDGIQPVVTPSPEEVAAAKWRIHYREDSLHFAVVGVCGKRKSSFLDALRGSRAPAMGSPTAEGRKTTLQMTGYPDANSRKPFVWYDIPAASNLKCQNWQHFNNQGFYVFDSIILFFDSHFTSADIAILVNARRFDIPTYIVRTNADEHIRRIMKRMRHGKKGGVTEDAEHRNKLYQAAREQFIEKTRKSVWADLEGANLSDQRVYIVSKTILLNVVQGRMAKNVIDEVDLLNSLLSQAYSRRFA